MQDQIQRLGISPERFRIEWISAAEGEKYARVITEMSETLKGLDREQILSENRGARDAIERRLRRWKASPQMAELMAVGADELPGGEELDR